jgi:hypothetical protein
MSALPLKCFRKIRQVEQHTQRSRDDTSNTQRADSGMARATSTTLLKACTLLNMNSVEMDTIIYVEMDTIINQFTFYCDYLFKNL